MNNLLPPSAGQKSVSGRKTRSVIKEMQDKAWSSERINGTGFFPLPRGSSFYHKERENRFPRNVDIYTTLHGVITQKAII
jgi:hypothetical protein